MNAPTSSRGTGDPFSGRPELTAEASEEQLLYAKILNVGMYLGLGILLGDKKAGPFKLEIDWIKVDKTS